MNVNFTSNHKLNKILNNTILLHSLYWIGLVTFFGFFWGYYDYDFRKTFRNELVGLPVKMMVVYFLIYFLFPRFLYTKKYTYFITALFGSLLLGGLLNHNLYKLFVYPKDVTLLHNSGDYAMFAVMHRIVDINSVLIVPATIKLFQRWYQDSYASQILEKEKLEAELNFLKGQIQPHFLFNTLNNLYSLILKKSDEAPDVVIKLSDLMRYLIYDTAVPEVALAKEIINIKNYVALEKIRFGNRIDVSFHTFGDISGITIAPLIILPIVENSFKHSTKDDSDNVWITIEISVLNNTFTVKVENNLSKHVTNVAKKKGNQGVGLANLKRRLDLLYSNKHHIKIKEYKDSHLVVLKIQLGI